jgi:hypothetical protein
MTLLFTRCSKQKVAKILRFEHTGKKILSLNCAWPHSESLLTSSDRQDGQVGFLAMALNFLPHVLQLNFSNQLVSIVITGPPPEHIVIPWFFISRVQADKDFYVFFADVSRGASFIV